MAFTEIAGVMFDNRKLNALRNLIATAYLFNDLDGEFANQSGGTIKDEGPFYGRVFYAAHDLMKEMGFSDDEAYSIYSAVMDDSIVENQIKRTLNARKDCDLPPYYGTRNGGGDCQGPDGEGFSRGPL